MYLTDPSLYGVTLPQREAPISVPFMNPFLASGQNVPFQGLPWQAAPWQHFQKYVPPILQNGISPHFGQAFGYTAPFMTAPFAPTAFRPTQAAGSGPGRT